MVKKLDDKVFTVPTDPKSTATKTELKIWDKTVESYVKRIDLYAENKSTLYSVLWGQCTDTMKTKIKALANFKTMSEHSNSLTLLKEIKGISYRFESRDNIYMSMDDAKALFYTNKQSHDESNANYLTKFKDMCEVIKHYGGSLCDDKAMIKEELANLIAQDPSKLKKEEKEDYRRLRENRFLDKILLTYTINYCYTKRLNCLGDLAVFQNFPTAMSFLTFLYPII